MQTESGAKSPQMSVGQCENGEGIYRQRKKVAMDNMKLNGQKTYEYIFNYFSEKILSGELKLNDKIDTERDIAEKLGVSRNSVREVMHMLEMTGLIECLQGSGNYVRCNPEGYMLKSVNMVMALMEIDYTEILEIRTGYEHMALKLAISNATEEELESIHQILIQMDQPMSTKESAALDNNFHHMLVEASHNRLLILYYSMLDQLLDRFIENMRSRILVSRMKAEQLRKAHWNIYESLLSKNMGAGMSAMYKHFQIVDEQVKKLRQKESV